MASSPVLYRDNPEWLAWSLGILALITIASTRWKMKPPVGLVVFVGWAALSALWTYDPAGTAVDLPTLIASVVIGSAIATFGAKVVARGLMWGALLAVSVSLAVGVIDPSRGRSAEFDGAFVGIYAHRNFLASVAVIGVALSIAYLLRADTVRARFGYCLTLALFSVGSVATLSGSAIAIAATVTLGGAAIWLLRAIGVLGRLIALPIIVVLFGGFLVPWLLNALPQVTELVGRDATFTGRTDIWEIVLSVASKRPMTGYGWGGVWRGEIGDYVRTTFGWDTARSAHNGFLDALVQVGWVGATLLIAVIVVALARSTRLAFFRRDLAWLSLVILAVVVNSASESQITRPLGTFILAAVASIALAETKTLTPTKGKTPRRHAESASEPSHETRYIQ